MTFAAEFQKEMESFDFALRRKLQGLLLFRLLVAVFFLLLTILAQSRLHADLLAERLQPLYYFSGILFAFTIVGSWRLSRIKNLKRFAYIQTIFDVLAVTVLVYLSGGVDSIFSFLYMPVIMSAAVLLMRRGSLWIASISTLCYGIMLDLQFFRLIQPFHMLGSSMYADDSIVYLHTLLMNICIFYLVAYISGYLAEELERSNQRIAAQQKDLRRLEMINQNIVQSVNSGLITVDLEGSIQHVNRHAQEVLGLANNDLLDRSIQEVLPGLKTDLGLEERGDSYRALQIAMGRQEIRYTTPSGDKLCLGYTLSALQDFSRKRFGWIINFQDLTAIREMETHIQRMERLALAGKIAAEIAHEIKNPLAAMSGSMQILQQETSHDQELARLTDIVGREIERINTLVTDFLWLAKSPPKVERIQPVNVCQTILDTIGLMKRQEEIASDYRVRTDFEVEPVLQLDSHIFQQVLWNLFRNAIEAMPGGGELLVRVRTCVSTVESGVRDRQQICIDVRDSGCGIAPELQEKIFEPFFTTKEKGTGLGLSTVYQLLQNCGGRIEVSSEPGRGSTFSILFPVVAPTDSAREELPSRLVNVENHGAKPVSSALPA